MRINLKDNHSLKKYTLSLLLFLNGFVAVWGQGSSGQNLVSSPYSNYGVGEWTQTNFLQAGTAAHTYSGHYSFSSYNPATLGNVRYTTLDFAGSYKRGATISGSEQYDFDGGGFEYMSLALPVWKTAKRKLIGYDSLRRQKVWKFIPFGASTALVLKPMTTVGYSYYLENDGVLKTRTSHIGSGGLSVLQWQTGFRLSNAVQLGYSAGYVFGTTKDNALFSVVDSLQLGVVEDAQSLVFRGLQQQAGLLFQFKLDSTYHKLGVSYEWYANSFATRNRLTRSMEVTSAGYTSVLDTILDERDVKKEFSLPGSLGVGYSFQYRRAFQLNLDWRKQMWSSYSAYFDNTGKYVDRTDYSIGLIINPMDVKGGTEKRMKMPVRLGYSLGQSQLQFVQNSQTFGLVEQRYMVGFGIPMLRRYFDNSVITNILQVNVQYLERRSNGGNFPKEQYITVGLGLQLGDIWFAQRKYD
jgi:hypothetical protein